MSAALPLWSLLVAAGVVEIVRYDTTPYDPSPAPAVWPRESEIRAAPYGTTVVMFVHPRCPCTEASKSELAAIEQTAPPTTRFIVTSDREEARRFGAKTSGDVVVYDMTGTRRFSGGITGYQGHVGHNVGHTMVDMIIHAQTQGSFDMPVFGCELEAS